MYVDSRPIEHWVGVPFVGDFHTNVGNLPFHVGDPPFLITEINYIDAQNYRQFLNLHLKTNSSDTVSKISGGASVHGHNT